MDPLDPLTEIVKTGQAFSLFILLERIIWLFIGFFFIGALSTSITKNMRDQGLFKMSFPFGIGKKGNKKNGQITQETNENVSKN